MKPKRIQRLVEAHKRIHQAKHGLLSLARKELRSAQTAQEQVQARSHAHLDALGVLRDWEQDAMPRAAEMVVLSNAEVQAAQLEVREREATVEAATDALQTAGYELRRFELMLERAQKAARRVHNHREQAAADDITGARGGRRDEGT